MTRQELIHMAGHCGANKYRAVCEEALLLYDKWHDALAAKIKAETLLQAAREVNKANAELIDALRQLSARP